MTVTVERREGSHRLAGQWHGADVANAFLAHLQTRGFSPATVRAYAYDILSPARFLQERSIGLSEVVPTDVFDWVDWQNTARGAGQKVVPISVPRAAPASVNRRAAAARAFFEYLVMAGVRPDNP